MSLTTGLNIDLSGKRAIVTGATGDLGRVMVLTLARAGADVAVHYGSNVKLAEKLVADITALGRKSIAVQADITDRASVFAMRDKVFAELGPIDIVCANAVIQYKWVNVLDQAEEDYEGQFRSCVLQNVLMAKAFIPSMIERGGGRYIGTNTECAMQMFPNQSAYVSGKRGMDGVLRVLAKEIGSHAITVNQVAPGWMISARDREAGTEYQEGYCSKVPLGHRGEDQDIANVVAFLASDLAKFISGAYIPVCGGNVMPCI
ncbi:MAG: SDR family oxidoreductase [Capsulimonadaceae bacterium]|nr:SDR family oxidoreductase [Capsulimonadaceae bacterium]